jgi:tetratricopeptide (TPR) repeat protein
MFDSISADIAAGRTDGLTVKIFSIADGSSDPYVLLKCMSILKLLPNDGTESKIGSMLVDMSDAQSALDIAKALYNLNGPYYSLKVLDKAPENDQVVRLRCKCMIDLEEYESAMEEYDSIKEPVINDRIMLSEIQTSVGEHKKSIETATQLLNEQPNDYDVRLAYLKALIAGGCDKEATKYVRAAIKDKSADSNALAAYVFRILGNTNAAGGYASRAVKLNPEHIGAMETLGICLALKGEYEKAKIVAGAINEISPGDKSSITILSYVDGH